MYDYLKGILTTKKNILMNFSVTVEVGGIGYLINTTKSTFENMPDKNEEVKIYVSLNHKEDSMSLSGFLCREERDLFDILQTVSGVGVKAAITLLDEFSVAELVSVVIKEDYKELSRTKGIGLKSAQKIVLELKDKLLARQDDLVHTLGEIDDSEPECISEVRNILLSLGYSKDEIENTIKYVMSCSIDKTNPEEILKHSLQYLAQQ